MTKGPDAPLSGSDYVVEDPPGWLPRAVARVVGDLTYREAHAAELGLLGIPLGLAIAYDLATPALTIVLATVAMAFGLRILPERWRGGRVVIRREPWYYAVILVPSLLVGIGLGATL